MASEEEIDRAVNVIQDNGNRELCLLHCRSIYPTPTSELNLRQIGSFRQKYDFPIGFSDHSQGIEAALGAVVLGASVIEKHFTLDKTLPGPDHHFSMDPSELKDLVKGVRKLEESLGEGVIAPTLSELDMRVVARRSIVAAIDLPSGHTLKYDDMAFKRPGSGLMPFEGAKIVGKKLKKAVSKGEQLTFRCFDDE